MSCSPSRRRPPDACRPFSTPYRPLTATRKEMRWAADVYRRDSRAARAVAADEPVLTCFFALDVPYGVGNGALRS